MIAYTIEVSQKSETITDLILSTDDKEIIEISKKFGIEVPFVRPKNLSKDTTKHIDVMKHAVSSMEKLKNVKYDYAVILQPTSPFRIVEDIDITVKKMIDRKADSSVSITEIEENHPLKIKKFENNKVLPYCLAEEEGVRRQDFADCL